MAVVGIADDVTEMCRAHSILTRSSQQSSEQAALCGGPIYSSAM